jgi:hypothetical protein
MRLFIYALGLQVFMSAINLNAVAQDTQRTIYGKVISFEESFPLKDVSVSVKDGKSLTSTKANGTFTLKVSENEKLILVSQEGYQTKEVPLTKSAEYNIVLQRK